MQARMPRGSAWRAGRAARRERSGVGGLRRGVQPHRDAGPAAEMAVAGGVGQELDLGQGDVARAVGGGTGRVPGQAPPALKRRMTAGSGQALQTASGLTRQVRRQARVRSVTFGFPGQGGCQANPAGGRGPGAGRRTGGNPLRRLKLHFDRMLAPSGPAGDETGLLQHHDVLRHGIEACVEAGGDAGDAGGAFLREMRGDRPPRRVAGGPGGSGTGNRSRFVQPCRSALSFSLGDEVAAGGEPVTPAGERDPACRARPAWAAGSRDDPGPVCGWSSCACQPYRPASGVSSDPGRKPRAARTDRALCDGWQYRPCGDGRHGTARGDRPVPDRSGGVRSPPRPASGGWGGRCCRWCRCTGRSEDQTPRHQRMTAFCACRRFSASSKITECGPSITALVASSLRCAGRQCMKSASGLARDISCSLT